VFALYVIILHSSNRMKKKSKYAGLAHQNRLVLSVTEEFAVAE
jgi:hypothetical protein